MKNMKIDANGTEIRVMGDVVNEEAYISLTDIAKYKNPDNAFIVVANWIRNHSTISFLGFVGTTETDILNMALFGKTAAQWRNEKGISGKAPNIRDFASAEELVVLINLEDTNADLIRQEVPKIERLKILREKAYRQLEILKKNQETLDALKKNLVEDSETNG